MLLTHTIQRAINFAALKHLEQKRKADGLPYVVHPFSVAWILSTVTNDEDVIVAGLLHDVLEDVKGYYFEDLERDFGTRVARLVQAVSEDKDPNVESDDKATWLERKQKYLDHLRSVETEALLVSAADKIHNLRSMHMAFAERGPVIWGSFNSPADKKLWFYEEVFAIVRARLGDHPLVIQLQESLDELKKELGE